MVAPGSNDRGEEMWYWHPPPHAGWLSRAEGALGAQCPPSVRPPWPLAHPSPSPSPSPQTVLEEMNRLGMIVDLAHVSVDTMKVVLNISKAPVIFSHSSAYSLCQHRRNVPDDVLKMVVSAGARRAQRALGGRVAQGCLSPRPPQAAW